jgi:hypothetical protein
LVTASLGLLASFVISMPKWPEAAHQLALFVHAEDKQPRPPALDEARLHTLDPRKESEFFAGLGDFLLRKP